MQDIPLRARPTTTDGFDAYWYFASERHQIYLRRLAGQEGPLTHDTVIAGNRFTNAYRAADRVSQYLIGSVQYNQDWDWTDTFARTLLFKIFNRIDTWEHVVAQIGEPTSQLLLDGSVDRAIAEIAGTRPIYSAAYIMPPPRTSSGPKYERHLSLIRRMLNDEAPLRVQSSSSLAGAFETLRSYPSIGGFLAYQYVTDLNYSVHLTFSEQEFVVAGPGAQRGLRKCFVDSADYSDDYLIRWTFEQQRVAFARRGLTWNGLWGRELQLIDIQNLFCEIDKYTRVAMPELARYAPGKRIKQRYRPNSVPIGAWFPPKWGINKLVSKPRSDEAASRCSEVPTSSRHTVRLDA